MSGTSLGAGTLRERPLPRLIYACEKGTLTGAIELDTPNGPAEIFLREGWLCGVRTAAAVDTLGRVLLELGVISLDVYHESLLRLSRGTRRHGDILREMGALNMTSLRHGLEQQLRRKLVRLIALRNAPFRIMARDPGFGQTEGIRVDPRSAIVQGIKAGYTRERLSQELARLDGQNLRVASDFWTAEERYGFDDEDRRALEHLRTFTSRDALEGTGDPEPGVARTVLYTLWITDGLELQPATSGARPRIARVTAQIEIDRSMGPRREVRDGQHRPTGPRAGREPLAASTLPRPSEARPKPMEPGTPGPTDRGYPAFARSVLPRAPVVETGRVYPFADPRAHTS